VPKVEGAKHQVDQALAQKAGDIQAAEDSPGQALFLTHHSIRSWSTRGEAAALPPCLTRGGKLLHCAASWRPGTEVGRKLLKSLVFSRKWREL
jgi:hypothetical protein